MKKVFLFALQNICFQLYFFLDKSGFFNINIIDTVFIKFYFLYKSKLESINLDFLELYLSKNITVVDVGANIGYFTVQISKYLNSSCRIIAIEPNKKNVHRMNKTLNNLSPLPVVNVLQVGLSDLTGISYLKLDPKNPANHQITKYKEKGEKINIITLDSLCSDRLNVRLVKIDVQGHEFEVLKGGENLIITQSPMFLIEIDNRTSPELAAKIWDYLNFYSYFILSADKEKKVLTRSELINRKGYFDIFCISKKFYK